MIGVIGPSAGGDQLLTELDDCGYDVTTGDAGTLLEAECEVILATEETRAHELARGRITAPIVFIDGSQPIPSVSRDDLPQLLEQPEHCTVPLPVFSVAIDGQVCGGGVFEVLLSAVPGRISTFEISLKDICHTVRADGVIVATPRGSRDYAHRAGGPLVYDTETFAVVPIAPFTMDRTSWVIDSETDVEVVIRADDDPVSLLIDQDETASLESGSRITITLEHTLNAVLFD